MCIPQPTKTPSFFEAEELGTVPQPHCDSCKKKVTIILAKADVGKLRSGDMKLTRRTVLSFVMAQYGPRGLISPFLVHAKSLLHEYDLNISMTITIIITLTMIMN